MLAYSVQRWEADEKRWITIAEPGRSEFCKPYPLGIIKGTVSKAWLWPGHTIFTNEEATAARDALSIGDRARFVIFLGEPGDYSTSLATGEFKVDQRPQTDRSLSVTH